MYSSHVNYIDCVFVSAAECIAAKIRNVLKREGKFTDQHATFLLTKQTTKLNLTFSGKDTLGIGSKIVQVASRHCPVRSVHISLHIK